MEALIDCRYHATGEVLIHMVLKTLACVKSSLNSIWTSLLRMLSVHWLLVERLVPMSHWLFSSSYCRRMKGSMCPTCAIQSCEKAAIQSRWMRGWNWDSSNLQTTQTHRQKGRQEPDGSFSVSRQKDFEYFFFFFFSRCYPICPICLCLLWNTRVWALREVFVLESIWCETTRWSLWSGGPSRPDIHSQVHEGGSIHARPFSFD